LVKCRTVVLTGPHWQNFPDAYEALITRHAATVVSSAGELADAAARLLGDAAVLAQMRERGEQALEGLSGALPRTVEALLRHLPAEDELAPAS
jgi:3-deoxy-D-manno-octulosonic-acid transferase